MHVGGFVSSVIVLFCVGCLSDPTFDDANDPTTATDTTVSTDGHMVLVPTTTLSKVTTQETKKGKGKDGDDHDATKAEPAPAPAPPPAPSSIVVPAFWIDAAPVSPAEYDACANAGTCARPSCVSRGEEITCITHAQASTYCAWKKKRLVRDSEWSAAVTTKPRPTGLIIYAGDFSEWVDARETSRETSGETSGIARGGATSDASLTLGLDSSIPTVGFRCARDR